MNCSTCTTGTSTTLSTRSTTGMSTTLSKNWTAQRRQQLRNLHSFLHCLKPLHLQPNNEELQLRNLHSFQHRVPRLVDDLLSKTLESPSWEKTSKTTRGTAMGTSATLSKSCTVPKNDPNTTTNSSTTLSKNCTTPPATAPDPRTIREPTLGLPGAAPDDVIMTVVSLCTGLWGPRVRGSLSRRRRHRTVTSSGQQLPKECRPSSDPTRCTCRPLGPPATVTPGRLLASLSGAKP